MQNISHGPQSEFERGYAPQQPAQDADEMGQQSGYQQSFTAEPPYPSYSQGQQQQYYQGQQQQYWYQQPSSNGLQEMPVLSSAPRWV